MVILSVNRLTIIFPKDLKNYFNISFHFYLLNAFKLS